jgi:hypothetical protein
MGRRPKEINPEKIIINVTNRLLRRMKKKLKEGVDPEI